MPPELTDLAKGVWVRFLIGDTGTTQKLADDTIDALLVEHLANKYCAAAAALDGLLATWLAKGGGMLEREVDELRIKYASGADPAESVRRQIAELKRQCMSTRTTSSVFGAH